VGARILLTAGSIGIAAGLGMLALVQPGSAYLTSVLPGQLVFGVGLVLVVAPVTTTALGDVRPESSGAASGVNNAVARVAGLVAIAVVPWLGGLTGAALAGGEGLVEGYQRAMVVSALLGVIGAAIAWLGLPPHRRGTSSEPVAAEPG
jgi:hypothetical protein